MATLPNFKTLFIPHKTMPKVKQPEYGDDMRAIEIFMRSQKAASATVGAFGFSASHASANIGVSAPWGSGNIGSNGALTVQGRYPIAGSPSGIGWPPADNISGTTYDAVIGQGGMFYVPTAGLHTILTSFILFAPNFTGPSPTVGATLVLSAAAANGVAPTTSSFHVVSHQIALASGTQHLLGSADFSAAVITGTDLTWTGTSNMALNCGNSATLPYIISWSIIGVWDAANSYT